MHASVWLKSVYHETVDMEVLPICMVNLDIFLHLKPLQGFPHTVNFGCGKLRQKHLPLGL